MNVLADVVHPPDVLFFLKKIKTLQKHGGIRYALQAGTRTLPESCWMPLNWSTAQFPLRVPAYR